LWAALARSSAILNVLNLVPVWVLDGSKAMSALNKAERIAILAAAVALFFFLDQGIFLIVAAGATYRLFTKDLPPDGSRTIAFYYAAVMILLALVSWQMPGQSLP
jgi:Zn-dependent protease